MTDTTFVDKNLSTPIVSSWLNDINVAIYRALGIGGVAPANAVQAITNLSNQLPFLYVGMLSGDQISGTNIQFDTTVKNRGFTYSAATGVATIPNTAEYAFRGVVCYNNTSGGVVNTRIIMTGSISGLIYMSQLQIPAAGIGAHPISIDAPMASGETIAVQADTLSSTQHALFQKCWWSIRQLV